MKAIGGYHELELNDNGSIYHDQAIALNTGRNALEFILSNRNYKRIYIPYYTCDVILEPFHKLKIEYQFYHLNKNFLPILDPIDENEALLYVNYFGLMNNIISKGLTAYQNIIIDNSQAFFNKPNKNNSTFYSPRKFFGVPDGGFAYVKSTRNFDLKQDKSIDRISHLIKRIEYDAESGYQSFIANNIKLENQPILEMSTLTKMLLKNVNFSHIKDIRNKNFEIIHDSLGTMNELSPILNEEIINGPMAYPFLRKGNKKLKLKLIKQRIFVATYWPNVKEWLNREDCFEIYLQDNLIPIPIDQRYGADEMKKIIDTLKK